MVFMQFMRQNLALAPLFVIAGAGCAAAVTYPRKKNIQCSTRVVKLWVTNMLLYIVYLLKTHPEIQIDKKNNPYPWQSVQQHQNIKLINATPAFYEGRRELKRPQY
ncbi:unnamed protein product [Mucor circinelloides]